MVIQEAHASANRLFVLKAHLQSIGAIPEGNLRLFISMQSDGGSFWCTDAMNHYDLSHSAKIVLHFCRNRDAFKRSKCRETSKELKSTDSFSEWAEDASPEILQNKIQIQNSSKYFQKYTGRDQQVKAG